MSGVGNVLLDAITPGKIGLGLAAGVGLLGTDTVFDILKERYKALNMPTWQTQGQAKLFGENADTYSFVKGRETLYKGMYEIPYSIAQNEAQELVDTAEGLAGGMVRDYKTNRAFEKIVDTPEVQAMGRAKAKILYDQLAAVAPDVMRKAPATALTAMQSAIASDSLALRPETIYNLARAQDSIG